MIPKQRRFLIIKYWVGSPTSGALVGPVLVSTSDYHHFHFWDELDAATFGSGDYEIVKVYPLGSSFTEAQRQFAQEFPSEIGTAWPLPDAAAYIWQSGSLGQPCLSA
jgi:hypothetical protein